MDIVEVKLSSLTIERLDKLGTWNDDIDYKINKLIDNFERD